MGTLTIKFKGICIHMTEANPYRVVVPTGTVPLTKYSLAPTATFPEGTTIDGQPLGEFVLDGQKFLARPTAAGLTARINLQCMPHLGSIVPNVRMRGDVMLQTPKAAGAWFNLVAPNVSLLPPVPTDPPVAYAQAAVHYPGDEATLLMEQDGTIFEIVVPQLPQTIVVSNIPTPAAGATDPLEYMANFLVTEDYPTTDDDRDALSAIIGSALDLMVRCLGDSGFRGDWDSFPSCSNSQWP